jgi:thiol:disulfide interchange protein DsbD
VGSFFTGLLAVLVATPCTAPFMGVAITAALAGSAGMTLGVFTALGLGLAAPYVLLSTVPAVARALPRPGQWMVVLRQALAFPMYGAAAWLVWVLAQEAGPDGVLAASVGFLCIGVAGWLKGLADRDIAPRLGRVVALAALLAAGGVMAQVTTAPAAVAHDAGVEPFSAARLAELRKAGKTVFVNMTAAWCVTCLINERVALSTSRVRDAFAERGVVYMKGDWTRQDPAISAFLSAQGRDGVPLYLVFSPGRDAPSVLPQVLTERAVLDAIGG